MIPNHMERPLTLETEHGLLLAIAILRATKPPTEKQHECEPHQDCWCHKFRLLRLRADAQNILADMTTTYTIGPIPDLVDALKEAERIDADWRIHKETILESERLSGDGPRVRWRRTA